MIVLRAVVRLVTFVLLVVLALAGLAIALACIGTGENTLSLAWLTEQLRLADVRDEVGSFLDNLEGASPPALAILGGLGAVLLGVVLLVGLLVPARERLFTLETTGDGGRLSARRRPLGQIAGTLVEQVRGVTGASTKVRPGRRTGGRLRITADRTRTAPAKAVEQSSKEALAELTSAFKLRARVRSRLGESGARVQ